MMEFLLERGLKRDFLIGYMTHIMEKEILNELTTIY
jgi:hypothetical protein